MRIVHIALCRASAYAALSEYVLKRRRAAAEGIAAAAQTGGEGGTVLHQLPDFLIPYLIQVRALLSLRSAAQKTARATRLSLPCSEVAVRGNEGCCGPLQGCRA